MSGVGGTDNLFQFTPLREGRLSVEREGRKSQRISIHAPPRGATQRRTRGTQVAENFNSRPSARGDRLAACRVSGSTNFNSRPSARGDSFSSSERRFKAFQFTPLREGRRERAEFAEFARPISIHAPPRGATGTRRICGIRSANFNSRPSARGDVVRPCDCNIARFQFTPLREGRRGLRRISASGWIFQFTPLREGRPVPDEQSARRGNFNSRPSARGD